MTVAAAKPRFAGFGLMSRDVPRLAAFYRTVLRTEVEDDPVHVEVEGVGVGFAIYNDGAVPDSERGDFVITFDVEDVDAEYERLQSMGVTILTSPTTRPWGMRNMCFEDPDGNRVVFRTAVRQ
ncbi:VOC family protein [Eubacteriales bacterium OttesenSCG-928-A19]|nr:VOC family protein [Eubacteriales bacterium OttesenSCG-928-A19]